MQRTSITNSLFCRLIMCSFLIDKNKITPASLPNFLFCNIIGENKRWKLEKWSNNSKDTLHIGAIKTAPSQKVGFFLWIRRLIAPPIDSPNKNLNFFEFSLVSANYNIQDLFQEGCKYYVYWNVSEIEHIILIFLHSNECLDKKKHTTNASEKIRTICDQITKFWEKSL